MKLYRDSLLVAEGKATREPGEDGIFFAVATWHAQYADAQWKTRSAWRVVDDEGRARDLPAAAARTMGIGVDDALRSLTVDIFEGEPGLAWLDVRDDPDA